MVYIKQAICNYIIFCGKKSIPRDPFNFKLSIASTELYQVSSTRFLGIIMDENLNWKEHVEWMTKKVNKSLGKIRKISHQVSSKCLIILYYSLICPYLSYCNMVWASTFPITL